MPAAPEIADKTKHSVTLSWKPPERDGGSPIKGYIIQIQDEGKSDWVRVNDPDTLHPTTEFTVPSLRALKRHRFRIIAVNAIGESDPSPRTGEVLVEDIQRTSPFGLSHHSSGTFGGLPLHRCFHVDSSSFHLPGRDGR